MSAAAILRAKLQDALDFMHSKRRGALWRVVGGLLTGQQLWLTELGRSLPGACSTKHRVKAVDRFLASARMQLDVPKIYGALAAYLLRAVDQPIILVDWTGAGHGFFTLSASVAFSGRALTILARTYPEKKKSSRKAQGDFLKELKTIVPESCHPVLVTDAGFLFSWADAVLDVGWDYVCRVRLKKMRVTWGARCMRLAEVYELARRKPRDMGSICLGKRNPRLHRAILSARPKRKGRKRLNLRGQPRTNGIAKSSADQAREPLFLITSLQQSGAMVVSIYRLRMQIEQTFRDFKSHRYGWSTRHIRSSNTARIDLLFLIGALAAIAMHMLGLAVRGTPLAFGFQANTVRSRTVFSTFFLGKLVLKAGLARMVGRRALRLGASTLLARVQSIELLPA